MNGGINEWMMLLWLILSIVLGKSQESTEFYSKEDAPWCCTDLILTPNSVP